MASDYTTNEVRMDPEDGAVFVLRRIYPARESKNMAFISTPDGSIETMVPLAKWYNWPIDQHHMEQ